MRGGLAGFVCRRCGECCRIADGIVRLSDRDVSAMSELLSLDEADFIDRFCDISPDRRCLVLKDAADGRTCVMLDGLNRCRVYPVRPEKCRTFPHEWTNDGSEEYCPGLAAAVGAASSFRERHGGVGEW